MSQNMFQLLELWIIGSLNHLSPSDIIEKKQISCWRDGSIIRSTGYSCIGPGRHSQHPYDSWKLSVPSVPQDLDIVFWNTQAQGMHMVHTNKRKQNTHALKDKLTFWKSKLIWNNSISAQTLRWRKSVYSMGTTNAALIPVVAPEFPQC